jgi:hypothetical protein
MNNFTSKYIAGAIVGVLLILVASAVVALLTLAYFADGDGGQSPSDTFTTHIQSLEDGDYQAAYDRLASDCEITEEEVTTAFTEQPIDPRDWDIRKEFMGDDEALLYFYGLENVVQRLVKEEGDWLLSCELP